MSISTHFQNNSLRSYFFIGATDPEEFHLLKRMFQPDVSDEKEELKQVFFNI